MGGLLVAGVVGGLLFLSCSFSLALPASPNVGDPEGRFVLLWLSVAVGMGWVVAVQADVRDQISGPATAPLNRTEQLPPALLSGRCPHERHARA